MCGLRSRAPCMCMRRCRVGQIRVPRVYTIREEAAQGVGFPAMHARLLLFALGGLHRRAPCMCMRMCPSKGCVSCCCVCHERHPQASTLHEHAHVPKQRLVCPAAMLAMWGLHGQAPCMCMRMCPSRNCFMLLCVPWVASMGEHPSSACACACAKAIAQTIINK